MIFVMEHKKQILEWILEQKQKMNYFNKRFQDSLMNYFLESYMAPMFQEDFNMKPFREIHSSIKSKIKVDSRVPKYMSILNAYINEIHLQNKEQEHKKRLCSFLQEQTQVSSSNYHTIMWKKCVSLLLLYHSLNPALLNNFRDMWECTFPGDPLKTLKLPKCSKNNHVYYHKRVIALKQKQTRLENAILQNQEALIKVFQTNSRDFCKEIERNCSFVKQLNNNISIKFPDEQLMKQENDEQIWKGEAYQSDSQLILPKQEPFQEIQGDILFFNSLNYFQNQTEDDYEKNIFKQQNSLLNSPSSFYYKYEEFERSQQISFSMYFQDQGSVQDLFNFM